MKMQRLLAGTRILSLIGQQGVGKSTLAKALHTRLRAQYIEASDVVRELHGNLSRVEMPKTNAMTKEQPEWLGRGIHTRITRGRVILSGVREEEVHEYLRSREAELEVISLWAPEQERFARLRRRLPSLSYEDFVAHGRAELDIGLARLLETHPPRFTTSHQGVEETVWKIMNQDPTIP